MTERERPEGMSVSEHTVSWHVCRSFSSTHLEDDCPCPQEACGFVARDKADPSCPEHSATAVKTIRRSHRPDACPGHRDPSATAVDWGKIYNEDEAWLAAHADELVESLEQLRDGDILPALPVAQERERAAEERVTIAREALTGFLVRVIDEDRVYMGDVYEDQRGEHTVMDQYLYMVAVLEGAVRAQERLRQEDM